MTGLNFLYALAAHIAWMDGRDHGVNGQLAILFCIKNRIDTGWENGDLGRIIQGYNYAKQAGDEGETYQDRYIFMSGLLITKSEIPDVRDPSFQQVLGYVEGIFDGTYQDRLTEGALYWGDKPIGAKERVAQVGTFLLWK